MTSVGETLRRERERRRLELRQVSNETKISLRLLEAIEAEQFEKLPGGVFTRNFVRQYARLLGLDEEEIAAELARVLEPEPAVVQEAPRIAPSSPEFPGMAEWETVSDSRHRWTSSLAALGMMIAVIALCSLVYMWWQRERRPVSATAPATAQNRARPQTPQAPQSTAQTGVSQPAGTSPAGGPPEKPQDRAGAAPPALQNPPDAAEKPPVSTLSSTPATEAGANGAVHVEMTAAEPVWVLARADGKFEFSATMEASERRSVDGKSTVLLRVGNAGGVAITLNGKPIGPLGPKNEPRTVEFTPGGFHIIEQDSASPPAPSKPSADSPDTANDPGDDTPPKPKPPGGVVYDPLL
jgi:cytoskeleton protein RodZ